MKACRCTTVCGHFEAGAINDSGRGAGQPTRTKALHWSGKAIDIETSFAVVNIPERGTIGSVTMARTREAVR